MKDKMRDKMIAKADKFYEKHYQDSEHSVPLMADFAAEQIQAERQRIAAKIRAQDDGWKTGGRGDEYFRNLILRLATELEAK